MPQTCPKCHRANPADALYCYEDGFSLGGRAGQTGPVDPGQQPFPHPFVFPNGAACRNFDQLALACHNAWPTAVELLRHGDLANFLAGVGRIDLAKAAREAARESDKDRALDQLLGQLPANTIEPAKLHVETLQVNLGQLTVGKDTRWELRLANQGMRMLSGTIAVDDCTWLALGEGGGSPRKVFQFQTNTSIPVQVRGKLLRAAAKPIQGRLVLETNGGAATVLVNADVPVQPFAEGALAGATTPRQVAEKAKKTPKEAASLFENGAVARWYILNSWTYPVQGPSASGIGAVQQFFEALGLTHPPKVELRQSSLVLEGRPGGGASQTLDVFTAEKRPIFASAVSDSLWLKVSRVALQGNTARVHLAVETVPDRPGETLQANVTVRANGNQRFVVPVALRIGGRPRSTGARRSDGIFPALEVVELTAPTEPTEPIILASAAAPPPVRRAVVDTMRPSQLPRTADTMRAPPGPRGPAMLEAIPLDDDDGDAPARRPQRGMILPLLPVAFILLGLLVTVVRDGIKWATTPHVKEDDSAGDVAAGPSGPPLIDVLFHDKNVDVMYGTVGMKPQGGGADEGERAVWEPSMRFGLSLTREADPQGRNGVKLTFSEPGEPASGLTNNTCVKLDGEELLFGETGTVIQGGLNRRVLGFRGRWVERETTVDMGTDAKGVKHTGTRSVWSYDREKVTVTQTVAVVGGAQSGRYDTCLARYKIENHDNKPHQVGLRFLLDTYIGSNDGVPFLIPGQDQLCDTQKDLQGKSVPDYLQALESEKQGQPGVIARLQLKVNGLEAPGRVTLGAYPDPKLGEKMGDRRCRQQGTLWDVPVYDISIFHDSAVTMYWDAKPLAAGTSREVGFAYGLGDVASSEGGKLRLTTGGDFTPGGEFTVTAEISQPVAGQTVTLTLPDGLKLADGGDLKRPVPAGSDERHLPVVTWKVKAAATGKYTLQVDSSNGASASKKVTITTQSLFGGN